MKDFPDMEYIKGVCKIGQGRECCRYLTMSPEGWECAKGSSLQEHLDSRVQTDTIVAQGDNCPGRGKVLMT